jgi:predicted transcriptional regulator of viral defense system
MSQQTKPETCRKTSLRAGSGPAEFNIFEAIGAVRQELRHSDFLAFLLNPRANHRLGDAFLKRLLKHVLAPIPELGMSAVEVDAADLTDAKVRREWQRIDILVHAPDNRFVCVIENKIDSGEDSDQLRRYRGIVQRHFANHRAVFIYLTPEGDEPFDDAYLALSYREVADVMDAVRRSRESALSSDLRILMEHYTTMLRRHILTGALRPLESALILHLERAKQMVVTIEDTMDILDCSYNYARQTLHRLKERRWLAPITPGTYELIPAERGEHAFPDTNPLFIGSTLVEPYYFSFATAAFFHGLSTQASATVYVATTVRKGRRLLTVRGKRYRLVVQPDHKFFGATEVDAYGSQVMMARPEKTVVDALDRPEYAGDVPEIAAMMQRGQGQLDWSRLAEYALRLRSQALVQRLGYLADLLDVRMEPDVRGRLLAGVGKSTTYLGRTSRWGTGGDYDANWRIVDNVPRRELLAEVKVV